MSAGLLPLPHCGRTADWWPCNATEGLAILDPKLWASTPFNNRTALFDLAGQLELWLRAVAQRIATTTGRAIRTPALGTPGGPSWLQAIQATYIEAHDALGIAPPPDLASYDLNDPADFASWAWLLSQTSQTLRLAAGIA